MSVTAETGHNVYRVYDLKTPPAQIGLIAGDVIHNLRSALDHLVYALVITNGSDPTGQRAIAFPVYDDAARYVAESGRKIKLASQSAINAINATEPYEGGNGEALWVLHYLDIADKHHALLTPLVNVTAVHLRFPGYWQREYRSVRHISVLRFAGALVEGDIIRTLDPEMKDDMNLTLDIAFIEPEVIRGKPLLPLLVQMSDYVDRLILRFKPLLV